MEQKIKIEKDILFRKYVTENMTNSEVANFFGCGKTTIIRRLAHYNITKPKELVNARIKEHHKIYIKHDPEVVRAKYIDENKTVGQIAEEMSCTSASISKVLEKHRILKSKELKRKHRRTLSIEPKQLQELYIGQNMSAKEIGSKFGFSESAVYALCKSNNITKPKELQVELSKKTWIKTGSKIEVKGLTVKQMVDRFNISPNTICKFIRDNDQLPDNDILEYFKVLKFNSATALEYKMSKALDISFNNKKVENTDMKYKPDFKLSGILYLNTDGLYWHSEAVKKDNRYHMKMRKDFEKNGLKILQFREDEVNKKLPIVTSMINNQLGKNNKIFARKTTIKEVTQKEASVFLNTNHIMGNYSSKHIGLYSDNNLVMIASYKVFKDNTLKIERLCSSLETTVVGGFSKLLKHFTKNYKLSKIHYWVDLRYGTGDFLLNHGFELSHETLGWRWTNFDDTYNRRICRANMDDRKLKEREHANELGLFKIYDAGQRLYTKEILNV